VISEEETPFVLFIQPLRWDIDGREGFMALQSERATISESLDLSVGFPKSVKAGIFDSQGRLLAGAGYEEPHPGLMVGTDFSNTELWAKRMSEKFSHTIYASLFSINRIIPQYTHASSLSGRNS
jgi:hypothetical protein